MTRSGKWYPLGFDVKVNFKFTNIYTKILPLQIFSQWKLQSFDFYIKLLSFLVFYATFKGYILFTIIVNCNFECGYILCVVQ